MKTSTLLPLAALLACSSAAACGSLSAGTFQDALGRWRIGDSAGVVRVARETYERFRDDNGVPQAAVEAAADEAWTRLSEEPVIARGDTPEAPPDVQGGLESGASFLAREIQADLLSDRVTPVMRASLTVRDLAMANQAAGVLTVIYRRAPYAADGGVLVNASTALRSVVAKWTALAALEAIAKGGQVRRVRLPGMPLAPPR